MNKVKIGRNLNSMGDVELDIQELVSTRMLIQSNSGGGKSYAIRKILEATHGKVQHIVLDLEGEFSTLRENHDYLLVGKDGDIDISVRIAETLARKILELGVSTIIDLYELKQHERTLFVKRFLDALVDAPKKLWHPVLIFVDEAHVFCPEKAKSESTGSVIELCTRGRKRGFCAILATQRLSKLNKDAAAECNSKIIGRTGMDIDMKRAAEELGFASKTEMLSLRNLNPGEFYYFGPALSPFVKKMKVGAVKTTHPDARNRQVMAKQSVQPTDKIMHMIKKLSDLPHEAEKELKTKEEMKSEITRLRREIRMKPVQQTIKHDDRFRKLYHDEKNKIATLQSHEKELSRKLSEANTRIKRFASLINNFISSVKGIAEVELPKSIQIKDTQKPVIAPSHKEHLKAFQPLEYAESNEKTTGGALRMLKAAAMYYPNPVTRARMATIARMSYRSGTFGTYLAHLKRNGLIVGDGNAFTVTEDGMKEAGDIPPIPSGKELLEMWKNIVKGGAARMLQALADVYPDALTREDLGERAYISSTSGTFGTYLATLKRNGLVKVDSGIIKASRELFGDE